MRHGPPTTCPSVTAWTVARMRAKHQLVDGADIFADPFALQVIDSDGREMLGEPDSTQARRDRGFIAARSRIAEDGLVAARRRGVAHAVILGAGLDTTALRHPDLAVFEVDRPRMLDWKRAHLARIGLAVPATARHVPVDFEHGSLARELAAAGLPPDAPAFFIWLGVTPYLAREAIGATLSLAASHPDAEIVFDYSEPIERLDAAAREAAELRRAWVAQLGEPWITLVEPPAMHDLLRAAGFTRVEDLDRAALFARIPSPGLATGANGSRSGSHVVHASRR